jgi:glucose uptake protein GlcU
MELTRTHKIIIAVAAVLLLAGLTVWLFSKKKAKKDTSNEKNFLGSADEALLLASQIDMLNANVEENLEKIKHLEQAQEALKTQNSDEFPLRLGSKGKRVEQLQAFLVKKYGANVIANGIWDEKTQQAVEKHLKQKEISELVFNAYNLGIIKTNFFK